MAKSDFLLSIAATIIHDEMKLKEQYNDSLVRQLEVRERGETWKPKELSLEFTTNIIKVNFKSLDKMERLLNTICEEYGICFSDDKNDEPVTQNLDEDELLIMEAVKNNPKLKQQLINKLRPTSKEAKSD